MKVNTEQQQPSLIHITCELVLRFVWRHRSFSLLPLFNPPPLCREKDEWNSDIGVSCWKRKWKYFPIFVALYHFFSFFVRKRWNFRVNFKMLNEELRSQIKRCFKEARREIPLNCEGCGKTVKLKIFSKKRRKIVLTAMSKMQEFYELSMAVDLNITNCD